MSTYTVKNAAVDLGFIDGYCRIASFPEDDALFDCLINSLDRIDTFVADGHLISDDAKQANLTARFLHDLGYIRGWLYTKTVPVAIYEALGRVIGFVTDDANFPCDFFAGHEVRPESREDFLSEHQRDLVMETAICGNEADSPAFARSIGASYEAILDLWYRTGVLTLFQIDELRSAAGSPQSTSRLNSLPDPVQPIPEAIHTPLPSPIPEAVKNGRREWTEEQRAAQAERAKGQKKPPFDEHLEAVKADFDAGVSLDGIGDKYGCSGSHIRNFLTKHGIDPRRGRTPVIHEVAPLVAEPEPADEIRHEQPAAERHSIPRAECEWKEEDRGRVVQLRATGISWAKIGDMMGRTGSSCAAMYHHLKHKNPLIEVKTLTDEEFSANVSSGATEAWGGRGRKITDDDVPTVREMVLQGKSMNVIGDHFGCGHQSVINFCAKHQIERQTLSSGLSRDDIPEVQGMLDKDCSYGAIGEWFGCDADAVFVFCNEHRLIPAKLQEEATARYEARKSAMAGSIQEADEAITTSIPPQMDSPAARWKPVPLSPDDWADIQQMLAKGRTRLAIASDYDVPVEDLDAFIEQELEEARIRRVAKESPPGEACAPLPS